jgi:ferredoxin
MSHPIHNNWRADPSLPTKTLLGGGRAGEPSCFFSRPPSFSRRTLEPPFSPPVTRHDHDQTKRDACVGCHYCLRVCRERVTRSIVCRALHGIAIGEDNKRETSTIWCVRDSVRCASQWSRSFPWSILHRVEVAFHRACLCWRGSISSRHYVKHNGSPAGVAIWALEEVTASLWDMPHYALRYYCFTSLYLDLAHDQTRRWWSDIKQPESVLLLLHSLVLFLGTTGYAFIFMGFSRWVHDQWIITPDADPTPCWRQHKIWNEFYKLLAFTPYTPYVLKYKILKVWNLSQICLLNPIHVMYLYMPFKHYWYVRNDSRNMHALDNVLLLN